MQRIGFWELFSRVMNVASAVQIIAGILGGIAIDWRIAAVGLVLGWQTFICGWLIAATSKRRFDVRIGDSRIQWDE